MLFHHAATPDDDRLLRADLRVGDFQLLICTDGPFLLDGGAMFGVVPKTLWQQRMPADADNNVMLGANTVVVRTGHDVVVIETGIGNKQPAKLKAFNKNAELLPQSLAAAGVRTDEVTHVVNTHLHFDHCGWNTTLGPGDNVQPTFAKARYFCAAGELAHGRLQLERDGVSYRDANYDPVIRAGQMTCIDPHGRQGFSAQDSRLSPREDPSLLPHVTTATEIVPGVWVEPWVGHTDSMLAVHIESAGKHACYISDLMPTTHHLQPTWVMGFDLDPLACIEGRKRFLREAIAGDWTVLFTHDHQVPAAKLRLDARGRPMAVPVPA